MPVTVRSVLRIGLTGGIGSGKSTVSALLTERGALLIDADRLAREVVEPGTPGLAAVAEAFGDGVLGPDGALDRPALAAIVFSDPEARPTRCRPGPWVPRARPPEAACEGPAGEGRDMFWFCLSRRGRSPRRTLCPVTRVTGATRRTRRTRVTSP